MDFCWWFIDTREIEFLFLNRNSCASSDAVKLDQLILNDALSSITISVGGSPIMFWNC